MARKLNPEKALGTQPDDAKRLRGCLDELGWSVSQLARQAGVSQSMLSLFLSGKRNLSAAVSYRITSTIVAAYDARKTGKPAAPSKFQYLLGLATRPPRDPESYAEWKSQLESAWDENKLAQRNEELTRRVAVLEKLAANEREVSELKTLEFIAALEDIAAAPDPLAELQRMLTEYRAKAAKENPNVVR